MVKVYVLAAFLIVVAASIMAAPIDGEFESLEVAVLDGHGKRQKREIDCDAEYNPGAETCTHDISSGACACTYTAQSARKLANELEKRSSSSTTPRFTRTTNIKKKTSSTTPIPAEQ